tara:strand:+ start:1005 stop:1967 length:963 start_codon:yes stop_codon:yes gene_type:complete
MKIGLRIKVIFKFFGEENMNIRIFLMAFILFIFVVPNKSYSETIGVISLHAKWSMPSRHVGYYKEIKKMAFFEKKFRNKCGRGPWVCHDDNTIVRNKNADLHLVDFAIHDAGMLIESPHCAWSKIRKYDLKVDEALKQCVMPRIERLKRRGAKKIVVLGKSLGANMAIRAGVIFDGLSGIIAMAPGHVPAYNEWFRDKLAGSVSEAKSAVSNGKGKVPIGLQDINQGTFKTLKVKPENYLSFFSPDGKAVMINNTAKLPKDLPFLWIVGSSDKITEDGLGPKIFAKAPKNLKSKYIEVQGGHRDVGENGSEKIIAWLKGL